VGAAAAGASAGAAGGAAHPTSNSAKTPTTNRIFQTFGLIADMWDLLGYRFGDWMLAKITQNTSSWSGVPRNLNYIIGCSECKKALLEFPAGTMDCWVSLTDRRMPRIIHAHDHSLPDEDR
jgi:hypothetical protein